MTDLLEKAHVQSEKLGDFQLKLKQALKLSNFHVPSKDFIDKMEESLDEKYKDDYYSDKELSKLISPRNCDFLITRMAFNKTLCFLKYLEKNYSEMRPSSEGLSKYIEDYEIDNTLRPVLIDIGKLTYEGNKKNRSYKWNGEEITEELAFHVCIKLKEKKDTSRKVLNSYSLEHDKAISDAIKQGKDCDWMINNNNLLFKDFPKISIKTKFNRKITSLKNRSKGDVETVYISKGHMPSVNSIFNNHLIDKKYRFRWNLEEEIVFTFYYYYNFENSEIAAILGKNSNQISQKKFCLKKEGKLDKEAMTSYFSKHNKLLNELFTEIKPVEQIAPETPVESENKKESDHDSDLSKTLGLISSESDPSLVNKPIKVLIAEITANRKEMKKNRKEMKTFKRKNKNKINRLEERIEFLDEIIRRFILE